MYPAVAFFPGEASPRRKAQKKIHQGYLNQQDLTIFSYYCPHLAALPEDLVFEILRWIPSTHLLDCKLVCKSWRVMIESPQFLEARSLPGLIVYYEEPDPDNLFPFCSKQELNIFHCSLRAERGPAQQFECLGKVAPSVWFKRKHWMTQIIDGLVCVHGFKFLKIWNVHTGESISLPEPSQSFESEYQWSDFRRMFYLGYVPSDGVYKLLKLADPGNCSSESIPANILTLGNPSASWRELKRDDFISTDWPPANYDLTCPFITCSSFYNSSDGFVHWIGVADHGPSRLLSFDVKQEKFHWINLPDDVIITRGKKSKYWNLKITQSMGCLALLLPPVTVENDSFLLYVSEEKGSSWSKHAVQLPPELRDEKCSLTVGGNLPSGEILLLNPKLETWTVPVYSYDHIRKKFGKFVVGKVPRLLRPILSEIFGHTIERPVTISCGLENLKPLDVTLSRGS